ncbi:hypothetical protein A2U01_0094370, partial [Trifolium medium]|nr:hypothetical protein [Trifolium medium]
MFNPFPLPLELDREVAVSGPPKMGPWAVTHSVLTVVVASVF